MTTFLRKRNINVTQSLQRWENAFCYPQNPEDFLFFIRISKTWLLHDLLSKWLAKIFIQKLNDPYASLHFDSILILMLLAESKSTKCYTSETLMPDKGVFQKLVDKDRRLSRKQCNLLAILMLPSCQHPTAWRKKIRPCFSFPDELDVHTDEAGFSHQLY